MLIVPTFLPSVSLSSAQLCQQAPIPHRESDPRLYSVFSSRNEIDPLNPLLFENLAPLRFTTCWGGAWSAPLSYTSADTMLNFSQGKKKLFPKKVSWIFLTHNAALIYSKMLNFVVTWPKIW